MRLSFYQVLTNNKGQSEVTVLVNVTNTYCRGGCTAPFIINFGTSSSSGQLHALASLRLENKESVPIKKEAAWAPELVWTFQGQKNLLILPEIE
jgi:hypothetical protein